MDSEFMAGDLGEPQQGPELELRPGRGDVEPVSESQPLAPWPRPSVSAAETDERTNVLPERESGAAPPAGANEPGHPGQGSQPAASWESPPGTATPPPASLATRDGMRPGAAEPAQRHQAGSPAPHHQPRPGHRRRPPTGPAGR